MTIQAIPTRYRDVLFRSRLEARWAVFFELAGIPWAHEPTGYRVGGLGPYLPDFHLSVTIGGRKGVFVEVKANRERANMMLLETFGALGDDPILLLDGPPAPRPFPLFRKGGGPEWAAFGEGLIRHLALSHGHGEADPGRRVFVDRQTEKAINEAMACRFEHGRRPKDRDAMAAMWGDEIADRWPVPADQKDHLRVQISHGGMTHDMARRICRHLKLEAV